MKTLVCLHTFAFIHPFFIFSFPHIRKNFLICASDFPTAGSGPMIGCPSPKFIKLYSNSLPQILLCPGVQSIYIHQSFHYPQNEKSKAHRSKILRYNLPNPLWLLILPCFPFYSLVFDQVRGSALLIKAESDSEACWTVTRIRTLLLILDRLICRVSRSTRPLFPGRLQSISHRTIIPPPSSPTCSTIYRKNCEALFEYKGLILSKYSWSELSLVRGVPDSRITFVN